MKEHPILFSGPMVKAILEGRKTQTRRVITPQPPSQLHILNQECFAFEANPDRSYNEEPYPSDKKWFCRYGLPGDRLWVKETYAGDDWTGFAYRATEPDALPFGEEVEFKKWKPSIFMPRSASRITLEVVNVRVEQVQCVDWNGAYAEGVKGSPPKHWYHADDTLIQFQKLWDSINAKRGFGWSTLWVWVIEFKKVQS